MLGRRATRIVSSFSRADALRGVSALALVAGGLAIATPAAAQVQPGSQQCPVVGDIVTCSGDVRGGILVPSGPYKGLTVESLTADIVVTDRPGITYTAGTPNTTIGIVDPDNVVRLTSRRTPAGGRRDLIGAVQATAVNSQGFSLFSDIDVQLVQESNPDPKAFFGFDLAGILVRGSGGSFSVINSGDISLSGLQGDIDTYAMVVDVFNADLVSVRNTGRLSGVNANHGILVMADNRKIDIFNDGEIKISGADPSGIELSFFESLDYNDGFSRPDRPVFTDFTFDVVNNGSIDVSGRVTSSGAGIFINNSFSAREGETFISGSVGRQTGSVTNNGTIATNLNGVNISTRGQSTVINNGRITTRFDPSRPDNLTSISVGMSFMVSGDAPSGSSSRSLVVNNASGVIDADNTGNTSALRDDATGVRASGGAVTIRNAGSISARGNTATALDILSEDRPLFFPGTFAATERLERVTIENSGRLLAEGSNARGISVTRDVRTAGNPTLDPSTLVTNSGLVEALGDGSNAMDFVHRDTSPNRDQGLDRAGAVTIDLSGSSIVRGGSGAGSAIRFVAGERHIVRNAGLITAASGTAIVGGTAAESIDNSGRIEGSVALGAGNDRMIARDGGLITGAVDGGAGTDVLQVDVGSGSVLFADRFGGTVTNFELLEKTGAGTFSLAQAVSPRAAVLGGVLATSGDLSSTQVDVSSGATLAGTGSVGATNIASGGRLAPGASGVGTFTINGNLVLQSGSITLIDVTPAGADRINVTGTATVNGGLTAFSSGGTLAAGRYTILNAAGGLTGTFGPFTTQGPFPGSPRLEYDANNAVLVLQADTSFNVLQRDTLIIAAATVTTQQVNLFSTRLLGRLNGGTPLFDQSFAVAFANAEVQAALVQARLAISNAGAPALIVFSDPVLVNRNVTSATTSASRFTLTGQRDTMTTETTTGGAGVSRVRGDTRSCGAAVAALPSGQRPTCAPPPAGETYTIPAGTVDQRTIVTTEYSIAEARTDTVTTTTSETYELNGTAVPVGTVHAAVQSGLYDLGSRFLARAGREGAPGLFGGRREAGRGSVWAETYGFRAREDARDGLPGERRDVWGVAGGFSMMAAPGIELGVGVEHGKLDLEVAATGETADVELTQIGVTGRYGAGPFAVAAALTYGTGEVGSARTFLDIASGAYDVEVMGGFAEARHELGIGGWRLAPVAGLDWLRIDSDGFTESGSFGFIAPAARQDRTRAFAGLEVGRELPLGRQSRLELTGSARYLTVLDGAERARPVAFAAAPGNPLVMRGLDEEYSFLVGAQARLGLSERLDLYLAYDGTLAGGNDAHAGTLGLRLRW